MLRGGTIEVEQATKSSDSPAYGNRRRGARGKNGRALQSLHRWPMRAGRALLSAAGGGVVVLGVTSLPSPAWPLLQVVSLLWISPLRRKGALQSVPPSLHRVAQWLCPQVVVVAVVLQITRHLFPDLHRTCRFWRGYLPIHVRYVFTKLKYQEARGYTREEVEAAWVRRHEWGAPRVSALLHDMSGYYVKSAQIMASKGDFLPSQWVEVMTPVFFDSMEPKEWSQVSKSLQCFLADSEMGREVSQDEGASSSDLLAVLFDTHDPDCLASASIAQVHAASLSSLALARLGGSWSHGPQVVLKVQHRDMQGLMDSDIRNLRRLCSFVRSVLPYDPTPMLDEMASTVGKEFDFRREARLMEAVAARLKDDGLNVRVPHPIMQLTTPDLLVMEQMSGTPLSRILQHNDPQGKAVAAAAIPVLIEAYGRMIFRHGLFHADPHAGNLMLSQDGDGSPQLVLLDFGQCKALPAHRLRALARVVIALDNGEKLSIAAAMSGFGMDFTMLGEAEDPLSLVRTVAYIIFDTRSLPEARINPLSDDATIKKIPLKEAPEDLFSLGRTVMLLRGLCHALDLDIQSARLWRPHAEAALKNLDLESLAATNHALDVGV